MFEGKAFQVEYIISKAVAEARAWEDANLGKKKAQKKGPQEIVEVSILFLVGSMGLGRNPQKQEEWDGSSRTKKAQFFVAVLQTGHMLAQRL